jgi:phenylalanyl-tRNA synthetase beta chain
MKVPLKWLSEYVELALPPAELMQRLTLAGLEVASVRLLGVPAPEGLHVKTEETGPVWEPDKIVLARVVRVTRHPNADKLRLVDLDHGTGQTKQVVTGAPNINVGDQGQKVILGMCGFQYFDGHATPKQLKRLTPTTLRGVPSDAMVCSSFELGIDEEHEGIILLPDDAPAPGTPLVEYLGDVVVEIDVLPNMARCLSMIGVAREVTALTGQTLRLPQPTAPATGEPIEGQVSVAIADAKLSPRYAAALLNGVRIGPAPGWMQWRLTYAGMRPINNIVDVTNYVMLEWGQPLHAFDYDKLKARAGGKAPKIIVRPARDGEVLRTLDGVERKLTADMLVIADEAGAIALAGVMGGAETEVSKATTNVLLESANFDFLSIRRTMRDLNLPSEASYRFSRGVHPELVRPALERAADLMRQYAGATVCRGLVDAYPAPPAARVIDLPMTEVRRILGVDLGVAECTRLLKALEYKVEPVGADVLRVTPPPHRLDIQEGAADLLEDLARLHGYDTLPATMLADRLPPQSTEPPIPFEERVRDLMVAAGLQEVITYSLTSEERERPLNLPKAEYVTLKNPISSERVVMRHSLLTGVLEAAADNLEYADDVRLFEIGSIYLPRDGERLPAEPRRLAIVLSGRRWPESWGEGTAAPNPPLDFNDLKGIIEVLVRDLHLGDVSYQPAREANVPVPALHPGKAAVLTAGGRALGSFGELHPRTAEAFVSTRGHKLAGRRILAGEFDLEALRAASPARYSYTPLSAFPVAKRDVALVVEEAVPEGRIAAEIREAGGGLLRDVRLFDLYRGEGIPPGHKSLAYALVYQADDRTLTDKEVKNAHEAIERRLHSRLGAQIRKPKDGAS